MARNGKQYDLWPEEGDKKQEMESSKGENIRFELLKSYEQAVAW